jgi:hypothetical protein
MRVLVLAVLAAAVILGGLPTKSAFAACSPWFGCPSTSGPSTSGLSTSGPSYSGAPGPIVGAGLPVLVILGGAYYVVRRRRRNKG